MNNMIRRLALWAVVVAGILAIPYLRNAPWTTFDYVFAGGVLYGLATIYEVSTQRLTNKTHKLFVGIAVMTVLMAIWAWAVA